MFYIMAVSMQRWSLKKRPFPDFPEGANFPEGARTIFTQALLGSTSTQNALLYNITYARNWFVRT
jgi:hypothetical protein